MWEYVFDYQQRIILQDKLSMNELCLLFYFSKQIIDDEFLINENPSEYKDFLYADIVKALPILNIEVKQLKNLIKKLQATEYIKAQKIFAGKSIALTFKALNSLSKKQSVEPGNKKYFFLLKWKYISTLPNFKNELGKKFPSFNTYYLYHTKNILYNNINKDSLDTEEDIIDDSSNINRQLLLPLFKKYPQFETKLLSDIILPPNFDCKKLINAIENSAFLQKLGIKFFAQNYDKITRGDYVGGIIVTNARDVGIQNSMFSEKSNKEAFKTHNYTEKELNSLFDDINEINL